MATEHSYVACRDSDAEKDPEEAQRGALADLMAKRSGTVGKTSRRAASAGPAGRCPRDDSDSGGDSGREGIKDSKRRVSCLPFPRSMMHTLPLLAPIESHWP